MASLVFTGVDIPAEFRGFVYRRSTEDFGVIGLPARVNVPERFRSRRAAELWLKRNLDAVRVAGVRHRACMCCGATFFSQGAHNRLCNDCRAGRIND